MQVGQDSKTERFVVQWTFPLGARGRSTARSSARSMHLPERRRADLWSYLTSIGFLDNPGVPVPPDFRPDAW